MSQATLESSDGSSASPSPGRLFAGRLARHLLRFFAYGTLALVLGGGALYLAKLEGQADLSPWHTVDLREEFRADEIDEIQDFAGYLELEERLFDELDRKVYDAAPTRGDFSRYRRGSKSDPGVFDQNWNRTFMLDPEGTPHAGLLLLHGMSDSPYSLRALGQAAASRGLKVVGLRLPGHGSAPTGMARATWKDMAAALRLAVRHLDASLGSAPIFIMGYSNGAALAVEYSIDAMTDEELPEPAGLILVSPAIGVRRLAALARWQALLARWLDVDKAAWNSVLPEVDPFKYTSFAVNGGAQTWALTRRIGRRLRELAGDASIEGFPPILAFLSVVDATVEPAAVVTELFAHLGAEEHELVLFDVNYLAESQALLASGAAGRAEELRERTDLPFTLTILGNESTGSLEVEEWRRPAGGKRVETRRLGLEWPPDVYALSHISLPFPPDDPVYGNVAPAAGDHVFLGRLEVMGERGVLRLPPSWLLRLRHNPFYDYVEDRALDWMGLPSGIPGADKPTLSSATAIKHEP